jgi:hypothetical protein
MTLRVDGIHSKPKDAPLLWLAAENLMCGRSAFHAHGIRAGQNSKRGYWPHRPLRPTPVRFLGLGIPHPLVWRPGAHARCPAKTGERTIWRIVRSDDVAPTLAYTARPFRLNEPELAPLAAGGPDPGRLVRSVRSATRPRHRARLGVNRSGTFRRLSVRAWRASPGWLAPPPSSAIALSAGALLATTPTTVADRVRHFDGREESRRNVSAKEPRRLLRPRRYRRRLSRRRRPLAGAPSASALYAHATTRQRPRRSGAAVNPDFSFRARARTWGGRARAGTLRCLPS